MLSQIDPRWKNVRLGTSTKTIGSHGCLLCCVTQILQNQGSNLSPADLNRWLSRHHGYVGRNSLVFDSLRPLGIKVAQLYDFRKVPADIGQIYALQRFGYNTIIEIAANPWRRFSPHWTLLINQIAGDLSIFDPLLPPSAQFPTLLLGRYARPDWGLERAICRVVAYTRADP